MKPRPIPLLFLVSLLGGGILSGCLGQGTPDEIYPLGQELRYRTDNGTTISISFHSVEGLTVAGERICDGFLAVIDDPWYGEPNWREVRMCAADPTIFSVRWWQDLSAFWNDPDWHNVERRDDRAIDTPATTLAFVHLVGLTDPGERWATQSTAPFRGPVSYTVIDHGETVQYSKAQPLGGIPGSFDEEYWVNATFERRDGMLNSMRYEHKDSAPGSDKVNYGYANWTLAGREEVKASVSPPDDPETSGTAVALADWDRYPSSEGLGLRYSLEAALEDAHDDRDTLPFFVQHPDWIVVHAVMVTHDNETSGEGSDRWYLILMDGQDALSTVCSRYVGLVDENSPPAAADLVRDRCTTTRTGRAHMEQGRADHPTEIVPWRDARERYGRATGLGDTRLSYLGWSITNAWRGPSPLASDELQWLEPRPATYWFDYKPVDTAYGTRPNGLVPGMEEPTVSGYVLWGSPSEFHAARGIFESLVAPTEPE